jgi:hypothetical protein
MNNTSTWQYSDNTEDMKLNYLLVQLHNILATLNSRTNSMEHDINMILQMESGNPNIKDTIKSYMWSVHNSFDDQVNCAFDCLGQVREKLGCSSRPTVDDFENSNKYTMDLIRQNNTLSSVTSKGLSTPYHKPSPGMKQPCLFPTSLYEDEYDFDDVPSESKKSDYADLFNMLINTTKVPFKPDLMNGNFNGKNPTKDETTNNDTFSELTSATSSELDSSDYSSDYSSSIPDLVKYYPGEIVTYPCDSENELPTLTDFQDYYPAQIAESHYDSEIKLLTPADFQDCYPSQIVESSYSPNMNLITPDDIKNELIGMRQTKPFIRDSLSSIPECDEI